MRVRLGTLKRILREVAVSPSAFANNKPVQDPMDQPNIAKALASLEQPFRGAIQQNMMLAAKDQYNAETREFDDQAWEQIKAASNKATEVMMARVHKAVQTAWAEATKAGSAEQPAPVAKKAVA